MGRIPEEVIKAWQGKTMPATLATVSEDGEPNVIYTSFVRYHGDARFIFTDHYFNKTRDNILNGSRGSLLFISPDGRSSYQLKGSMTLQEDGELYQQMKQGMPPTLPGRAIVVFDVDSVYRGGERLDSE